MKESFEVTGLFALRQESKWSRYLRIDSGQRNPYKELQARFKLWLPASRSGYRVHEQTTRSLAPYLMLGLVSICQPTSLFKIRTLQHVIHSVAGKGDRFKCNHWVVSQT